MSFCDKSIRVIIPAAGRGTRLHCESKPKAMHELCGRPLLEMVLENTAFIPPQDTYIVVGYKKDTIIKYFGDSYNYVVQEKQLGTGHAVNVCCDLFKDFDGTVLITFGDMPLFRREILEEICKHHIDTGADCTLLTAYDPNRDDWAKVIRDENGEFVAIVEGKDCTKEQNKLGELFAGVLVFDSKELFKALPNLDCENVQSEYYLTEVPMLMKKAGLNIETLKTDDLHDLCGVNTREDIKVCEEVLRKRKTGK